MRDGRIGAEGRHGTTYAVIGSDGSVQLPKDVLDVLPPGTLAHLQRALAGVSLTNPAIVEPDPLAEEDGRRA